MQHLLIAAIAYAAFVAQSAIAPSWANAGFDVNVVALGAAAVLLLCEGSARVAWVAGFGLLDDVLHRGPLGVAVIVAVVAAMSVSSFLATSRSRTERLLVAASFLLATTAVTPLVRGLIVGSHTITLPIVAINTFVVGAGLAAGWTLLGLAIRRLRLQHH